ncbi:LOW QUALITY PROTEIN: hypothetical protein BC937DRAFT_90264 [Endogone sp. FLAS-F59071]|nr:LOW QUALITY PROTEIN: hypothetical protein BC937DRAFT_90264 [Endogone sp. FLAS-F59071]|eukprot:RUS22132.1 LOW QUALITY PROTEIN: hypothetical protein BC937DRAFT_90264 [Endogone sp. FLAS-F59071]
MPVFNTYHSASPAAQRLDKRATIKEPTQPLAILLLASQEPPGIITTLGRRELNFTVDRIDIWHDGDRSAAVFGDERQPLHDLADTFEIIFCRQVRHAVFVHDLNLATEHLVKGRRAGQDDGLAFVLDSALAEPDEVCPDTDGAARNERDGKYVLVSTRGLTGNESRAAQILDAQTVRRTNYVRDAIPCLIGFFELLRQHCLLSVEVNLLHTVGGQVLEPTGWVLWVDKGGPDERGNLVSQSNARTRVGREVYTRDAETAGELRGFEKYLILCRTERTDLERDVVRDDDDPPTFGALWRVQREDPCYHTASVGARGTLYFL